MGFKEQVKQFLGPQTEWVPAPTEKQITRKSRWSAFLVIIALSWVMLWTMATPFTIRYWSGILFNLGLWTLTIWASYCSVVEISTMKTARASVELAERLRKFKRDKLLPQLPEDPLSSLPDLEAGA